MTPCLPAPQFPEDKWDAIIAVCLSSAFHATKAALPGMLERKWGRVINTGSMHALVASPYKSAYNAAKHGIAGARACQLNHHKRQPIACWVATEHSQVAGGANAQHAAHQQPAILACRVLS